MSGYDFSDGWQKDPEIFLANLIHAGGMMNQLGKDAPQHVNTVRLWGRTHGYTTPNRSPSPDSERVIYRNGVEVTRINPMHRVDVNSHISSELDKLRSKIEEYESSPPDPVEIVKRDRLLQRKDAELKDLKRDYKAAVKAANYKEDFMELVTPFVEEWAESLPDYQPPKIKYDRSSDRWDALLPFNDWHAGDIVEPDKVEGLNAYNLDILALRQQKHIDETIEELDSNNYHSLTIPLLGDNFSGMHNIHPEEAHEEGFITQQALSAALLTIQSTIDLLPYVPEIIFQVPSGDNHTRSTKKNNTAAVARGKSWSTLYHEIVAMGLRRYIADGRIKFHMHSSYKANFTVQGRRFAACHGHKMKGGGGSLGLPIYSMKRMYDATVSKTVVKAKRGLTEAQKLAEAESNALMNELLEGITDYVILGHFHFDFDWRVGTGGVIILPSTKGTDTFVNEDLEKYSDAAQTMIAIHPRKGVRKYSNYLQDIMDPNAPCRYNIRAGTSMLSAAQILNEWERCS